MVTSDYRVPLGEPREPLLVERNERGMKSRRRTKAPWILILYSSAGRFFTVRQSSARGTHPLSTGGRGGVHMGREGTQTLGPAL